MMRLLHPVLRALARLGLAPALHLLRQGKNLHLLGQSLVAQYSHRFGGRAILAVGALASVYAGYLYVAQALAPNAPNPSHDVILKSRLSSPTPSAEILIVDIDERSLAALSSLHGRWPWSRDVLADGLQKIHDLGARGVLFNVLQSDPDHQNPDADAAMEAAAQLNRATAFPLVRLPAQNDALSQLKVTQIPGARLEDPSSAQTTIAVILPQFGTMHDRLGVANQKPDADGIVRRYPLHWEDQGFYLPSIVGRTAELAGVGTAELPNLLSLNWRNKQGRYVRVSFSDLLLEQLSPEQAQQFKQAYVVLSLSAPGLGQTKATSVAAVEDDGEILATALDDALNGTYLRTLPASLVLLINLLAIWILVWLGLNPQADGFLTKAFVLAESGLGGITLLSASYTNHLIDLSDSMSFGLSVFATIKLVQSMDNRWSRARPGFRKVGLGAPKGTMLLMGFVGKSITETHIQSLQNDAERLVGLSNVVRVDDLFGGESFLRESCARFKALLIHVSGSQLEAVMSLVTEVKDAAVDISTHDLVHDWDPDSQGFSAEVAPIVLASATRLLTEHHDALV